MDELDLELIRNHIKKLYRVFFAVVLLIAVLELALTVRGLIIFNLSRQKLRYYLYSYLFLFFASVATVVTMLLCRRTERHGRLLVAATYSYAFCLMCWAAFVTAIDGGMANGDSGAMVFIMVSISIGSLLLIKPIFYDIMLIVSSTGMLLAIYYARAALYSSGFYINFAVFLALAIFINAHTYRISKREYEAGKKLKKLSFTDQLTGVYNRRHLDKQVAAFAARSEAWLFILIDIDDFKQVNDTHGHAVGDACLVMLAEKLSAAFGRRVYRFGGDEFAIISTQTVQEACDAIDRINASIRQEKKEVDLHISAGIYAAEEADSAGTVFIRADRALYTAKRRGKMCCAVYEKAACGEA